MSTWQVHELQMDWGDPGVGAGGVEACKWHLSTRGDK